MTDMTAFERQLSGEITGLMGPVRPVDDAAIFTAITTTQSPKWRFQTMFSATKFVVAGAIVALFGGSLLTGFLTQQPSDEPLPPAAASASATAQAEPTDAATTEPEPTSEAEADDTATADLLPGVDLVTEEVEPGVYKVLSDGVRDVAAIGPHGMSVGQDRSVWLWAEEPGRRIDSGYQAGGAAILLELGASGETRFDPTGEFDKGFTAVAADGTFWGPDLASFDGSTWRSHPWPDGTSPGYITMEATADGAIVVARSAGVGQAPQVARIEDGEWSLLPADGDVPADAVPTVYMATAPDGSVWLGCSTYHAASSRTPACAGLLRHDGDVWETVTPVPERPDLHAGPVAVGPDETLWVYLVAKTDPKGHYLARLTDGTWSVYGAADGVPMLEGLQTWESDLTVDEDGTLWIGGSQRSIEYGEPLPPPLGPSDPPHGVLSFDGTTWQQYLKGRSVERVEALDGIVWAADLDRGDGSGGLYVITPEAVASPQ